MSRQAFIEEIGAYVKVYAPIYGIKVCSPIIAQAILESGGGTSELAIYANNFFGLKYKQGRCPTASGVYHKIGSEQYPDGSYVSSAMEWCLFDSMEQCVIGYFDFISISRYSNLIGVTDPQTYVELIKEDGYATSLNYVKNIMNVIKTYNLTEYDSEEFKMEKKIIALDAGHGLTTSGKEITLVGYEKTKEWWLNDRIADRVEELLADYDCQVVRVGDTTGKKDISLAKRVKTANNIGAAVYVSIHHNAGVNGGSGGGTTVYYYSSKAEHKAQAQSLYDCVVANTKLVGNRSAKVIKKGFYVLANTNMPAFLLENGYMDSTTDVPIILSAAHAEKTAQGIVTWLVKEFKLDRLKETAQPQEKPSDVLYRVQCGAFSVKANAEALQAKLKAAGFDSFIVEAKK